MDDSYLRSGSYCFLGYQQNDAAHVRRYEHARMLVSARSFYPNILDILLEGARKTLQHTSTTKRYL